MNDIDIQKLIDDGYTENERLASKYEHKFSKISLAGLVLLFSPTIGYYLNNATLISYYWYIGVPLGLLFLVASIALMHTGTPVNPVTGKKMKHYRYCRQINERYENSVETYDVWVCHEGKTFCKRLFVKTGDFS